MINKSKKIPKIENRNHYKTKTRLLALRWCDGQDGALYLVGNAAWNCLSISDWEKALFEIGGITKKMHKLFPDNKRNINELSSLSFGIRQQLTISNNG